MAFNASGAFSQALELFSSLFQDMSASDLPAGLSPDNQDMWYFPGSVQTRPALNRLLSVPPNPSGQVLSVTEFPNPAGDPEAVFLYDSGVLESNDELHQTSKVLTTVEDGVQFKSESAFNKQWYAFFGSALSSQFSENPFVGADVPRYYDGQNVWRVTQDAPGQPPSFSSVIQGTATLKSPTFGAPVNIVSATTTDPQVIKIPKGFGITYYTTVTILTAAPMSLVSDQPVKLLGLTGGLAFLNGTIQTVTAVLSTTKFKIALFQELFAASGAGTVSTITGAVALQRIGGIVTATVLSGSLPSVGWFVLIGDQTAPTNTDIEQIIGGGNISMTRDTTGKVTIILTNPITNLPPGTSVFISGGDTHYPDGFQIVTQVLSPTTFTVQWPGDGTTAASVSPGNTSMPWGGTFQVITSGNGQFTYFQLGPDDFYTGTDVLTALPQSQVVPGPRTAFLIFASANGALTAPSIPIQLSAVGGANFLYAQNIAIGPLGTARRIIAFTPAFGSFVYYITPSVIPQSSGNPPIISLGTVINDNTTTSAILDFSDTQLVAGTRIDNEDGNNPGNDLFGQVVLSPCLGVIEYAQRLIWWGQINNLKTFNNAGFDGGYNGTLGLIPLGWDATGSTGGNGALISAPTGNLGFAYRMTSAGGMKDCLIQQGAYQTPLGAPIVLPSRRYYLRVLLSNVNGVAGNFVCDIFSPTAGVLGAATYAVTGSSASQGWVTVLMNRAMPNAIPSDVIVRVYLSGVTNAAVITIDEWGLVDAQQPVLNTQMIASYIGNPFGYNQVSGAVGFDTTESIVGAFKQRGTLYPISDKSLFISQNNSTTEPFEWNTDKYADECGCASPCAVTWGEAVAVWAGQQGAQMFYGSPPKKITQDIQETWDAINWNQPTSLWMQNDALSRVLYIGIPTGESQFANVLIPMNYRSVDSTYNVPDPFHVGLAGKLIATELVRKWSIWNVQAVCGAMVTRDLGSGPKRTMLLGAGSFGNLYYLNFAKFTDDDFGVIGGGTGNFYVSYGWWNHDMEQQTPQLGLFRKIYTYLTAFVTGVGNVQWTPFIDVLSNPWPSTLAYPLSAGLTHDLEWPLNTIGNRCFFKIQATPLEGQTDAAFVLTHMVVSGRLDKVFPVRGSVL